VDTVPGVLYLVATPIGNLQDITLRAIETLRSVSLIACEDTRHTRKLLNHFQISTKATSYHEHNEHEKAEKLVELMLKGESIAVVSDAGTPGICDPGFRVVRLAIEAGIDVVPVPGPVAFANALVGSGLGSDAVYFGGFLPAKKGERVRRLEEVRTIPATLVFYEAPHRLAASLGDCYAVLGDRNAAVARELTKMHEEFHRGTLSELAAHFVANKPKGEIVLVIDRSGPESSESAQRSLTERLAEIEASGVDRKAAIKQVAKEFGIGKSEAYRRILKK
jgi:16S rRNA (cytidine1402-2'-O)-methyltransferase